MNNWFQFTPSAKPAFEYSKYLVGPTGRYATIAAAIAAATVDGLDGLTKATGYVIWIQPGVYTETVTLTGAFISLGGIGNGLDAWIVGDINWAFNSTSGALRPGSLQNIFLSGNLTITSGTGVSINRLFLMRNCLIGGNYSCTLTGTAIVDVSTVFGNSFESLTGASGVIASSSFRGDYEFAGAGFAREINNCNFKKVNLTPIIKVTSGRVNMNACNADVKQIQVASTGRLSINGGKYTISGAAVVDGALFVNGTLDIDCVEVEHFYTYLYNDNAGGGIINQGKVTLTNGTGGGAQFITPSPTSLVLNAIINEEISTLQSTTQPQLLADAGGGSFIWNIREGKFAIITLTQNSTLTDSGLVASLSAGEFILKVMQDNVGGWTLTFDPLIYKFPNAVPPIITPTANAYDIITFVAESGVMNGMYGQDFG